MQQKRWQWSEPIRPPLKPKVWNPTDTIRLHGLGVVWPEMLLIEAPKKEVIQPKGVSTDCVRV